ncbi:Conserved oligomeric Golgi complex subunit 7 [Phytophthora citrophthora]|uniref:Conserved oligomeric Golgi complex subunit 7 n=1 Tax=Phytophthora citrophthora TaxID=4793 RepID=A0AAD9G1H4_9STRA|nr:Conserved oligomeric Golgi complex subunit 7 [Phytophthora citrophthora]
MEAASASPSFDAFAWVEEALSSRSGDASALAPLVPQLALRSQTLAQTLHSSLQHVSLSGPALQTRLQTLQQAATPLSRRLDAVQEACASGSVSTASSAASDQDLRHLVTLHEAKRRLQSCSQALVEAARWGRNVRACFAAVEDPTLLSHALKGDSSKVKGRTGDSDAADNLAERVREMQTSLEVLKELPGAWDRKQTMERLCAQIEAAVQPRLATKLREDDLGDVAPLRWCLDVLGSVDRAHLLREEFGKARPAHVHRVWYSYTDEMQTEPDNKDDNAGEIFGNWLENFYTDVLRMLQRESRSARELFGADMVASVLLDLLHSTFEPLTKSFRDRLVHSSPSGSDFKLARLLHCFRATRGFASQTVQLFRSLETDLGVNLTGNDATTSAEGIRHIIFEPYRLYFTEYARFTSDALTDALLRLVPAFNAKNRSEEAEFEEEGQDSADVAPLEDFSQRLEEASEAVWELIDESLQQCYEFTGGAAFPEAVEAIGTAVQQFTLALSSTIPAIRKYCKAEPASPVEGATGGSLVASPDWSRFHASLALLKACGVLEAQLCTLDGRVRIRMREQLAQFLGEKSGSSSPRSRRKKSHDGTGISLVDLVDPTKLVAAVSKSWLRSEDPTRQSQFHQFEMELLDHSGSAGFDTPASRVPSATLLDEAQRAVWSWTKEVQLLTYDTVFLPITRGLETLPTNENWRKVPDEALGDLPTFSMLPQDYITMVADLLLSLLPQLEPFAESSSLESAFVASRGAQEVCVQGEWNRLGQLLHLSPAELATCQRIFGSDGKTAFTESAPTATATEFVDLWTGAVASGTLAAFLRTVCSIPLLSDMGAQQLAADLGYFHNVLSAVGGEGSFIIDDLRRALEMDVQAHIHHAEELRADQEDSEKQALAKINDCIAAMRQRALERHRLSTSSGSAAISSQFT